MPTLDLWEGQIDWDRVFVQAPKKFRDSLPFEAEKPVPKEKDRKDKDGEGGKKKGGDAVPNKPANPAPVAAAPPQQPVAQAKPAQARPGPGGSNKYGGTRGASKGAAGLKNKAQGETDELQLLAEKHWRSMQELRYRSIPTMCKVEHEYFI